MSHHSGTVCVTIRRGPSSAWRDDVACLCIGANAGVCTDTRDGANGADSCSDRSRTAAAVQSRGEAAACWRGVRAGAVVSEVARRADVCASLIYRWRRELGQAPGGFAELIVAPMIRGGGDGGDDLRCLSAPPPVQAARPSGADVVAAPAIEIELAGSSRVRIPASMPPDLAAAVIAALRRR